MWGSYSAAPCVRSALEYLTHSAQHFVGGSTRYVGPDVYGGRRFRAPAVTATAVTAAEVTAAEVTAAEVTAAEVTAAVVAATDLTGADLTPCAGAGAAAQQARATATAAGRPAIGRASPTTARPPRPPKTATPPGRRTSSAGRGAAAARGVAVRTAANTVVRATPSAALSSVYRGRPVPDGPSATPPGAWSRAAAGKVGCGRDRRGAAGRPAPVEPVER
jgi:hypothetical protein